MAKKETGPLKWKRKKWYQILAPDTYGEQQIAETLALDPTELVGRTIEINLMHLTKNMKRQNFNMKFKVEKVENATGKTRSHELVMQPSSLKRLVRAGRDRIDESFIIKSNDGTYARIKPFYVTYNHQTAATRTKIRRMSVSFVRKYAAEKTLEEFFKEVVDGKLQKELHQKLRDVLRLRTCEVRALEVIENFSALKEKKLEKRTMRETKKAEQEESVAAARAEEKAERDAIRAEELAEINASLPKEEQVVEEAPVQADEVAEEIVEEPPKEEEVQEEADEKPAKTTKKEE